VSPTSIFFEEYCMNILSCLVGLGEGYYNIITKHSIVHAFKVSSSIFLFENIPRMVNFPCSLCHVA